MRNHAVKTFSIAQTAEMWYLAFPMKPTIVRNGIVIVFCDPMYQALREKISGVYSAATKYGWQILPVSDSPTKESIVRQIGIWNPIGIIIDPIHSAEKIPAIPKCRTPIILMGRDNYRDRQIFDCSCQDTSLSVTAAINELNSTRTYASYAFIGHSSNAYWSRDRGTRFREGVKNLGCFHEYTGPSIETIEGVSALVDWMKRLPKPCGLFLATDHLATSVFHALRMAHIHIPHEIAVISVDNVTHICQNVTPNLTSVMVNFSKAGENAIELLKRRIENPKSPVKTLTYGIIGVVKRASTSRPYTDKRLVNAVEFIANNSCSRISSKDVTDCMGCSRRMAEELFRRHTGVSILQAIQAARIATAKNLLKNGNMAIDDIPSFCGYDSTAFFKTVFRRETGMTMREWRNRFGDQSV